MVKTSRGDLVQTVTATGDLQPVVTVDIGAQSAVRMPSAMPGSSVAIASALGLAGISHGACTVTASALWN